MEDTITGTPDGVTSAASIPQQRGEPLPEQAIRYVRERHWDVLPGTWMEVPEEGGERCSCADPACYAPGAHPLRPDWQRQATGSVTETRRLWTAHPRASVLLPTGRTFDIIDVPEHAGCLALARMERLGTAPGPVSVTPMGRMLFFALPGGAAKAPVLLRQLGWAPASIDLFVRGEGDLVPAPPTRMGLRGSVRWVREPTEVNRWLPDAGDLLFQLAYACGRRERTAKS